MIFGRELMLCWVLKSFFFIYLWGLNMFFRKEGRFVEVMFFFLGFIVLSEE